MAVLAVASERAWRQGRAVRESADGQNVASCHANELLSSIYCHEGTRRYYVTCGGGFVILKLELVRSLEQLLTEWNRV